MALKLLMNARAGRLHRTPSLEEMAETLRGLDLDVEVLGSESPQDSGKRYAAWFRPEKNESRLPAVTERSD